MSDLDENEITQKLIQFIDHQYNQKISNIIQQQYQIIRERLIQLSDNEKQYKDDQLVEMIALDIYITENKRKFNWEKAARFISEKLTKQKLYHFYFETFQKRIYPQLSDYDKQQIRWMLEEAYINGKTLDDQLKQNIKNNMSQLYHFSIFNVYYNNQKRSIMKQSKKRIAKNHPKPIYMELKTQLQQAKKQIIEIQPQPVQEKVEVKPIPEEVLYPQEVPRIQLDKEQLAKLIEMY